MLTYINNGYVMIHLEMSVFIDVGVFCIICSTHSGTIYCALLSFPCLICVVNVCSAAVEQSHFTITSLVIVDVIVLRAQHVLFSGI